jgi:hypothetical protein
VKHTRRLKRTAFGGILLTSTVLLFMLVGTSLALTNPVFTHTGDNTITLRDACGTAISSGSGLQMAFSAKETCGACHNGTKLDGNGDPLLSYNEIERHAYHAQLAANEITGWGSAGVKPWAQSKGHFGNW